MMATRIAARELQDANKLATAAGKNGLAAAGSNNLDSGKVLDTSWYHYDRTLMREILSKETVFDPHTVTLRRKGELDEYGEQRKGLATMGELLHFNDLHEKMKAARQTN